MMNTNLVFDEHSCLSDICIQANEKSFMLLGASGSRRELSIVDGFIKDNNQEKLIVIIGLGLGHAIRKLVEIYSDTIQIAVIDKEDFIEKEDYKQSLSDIFQNPNVTIINNTSPIEVIKSLLDWRKKQAHKEFVFLQNSQYFRIDREYYKTIEKQIKIVQKDGLWQDFALKPFKSKKIKVLFPVINELIFDLVKACEKLDIEYKCLNINSKSFDSNNYANAFMDAITQFKPDMILTMNHLGIDQEGALVELAKKANLPIVSILLDSPYLMLSTYPHIRSDILSVFTYDEDTVPLLKEMGYTFVDFLPLGTNSERFKPQNKLNPYPKEWESEVSFVGASLRKLVVSTILSCHLPHSLLRKYKSIAKAFINSKEHIVKNFLAQEYSTEFQEFSLLNQEQRLVFEKIIIWESTRQYRKSCVEEIIPFNPAIIGDTNWHQNIRGKGKHFRYLGAIPYADIADFYTHSVIQFNTTSMQMKNAVNQRVFDVPVSNSFVITDWRSQMDNLLESGKEIISYKDKGEIPELVKFYLKNESARNKIIEAGRKRILSEHTWEARMNTIINTMTKRYN